MLNVLLADKLKSEAETVRTALEVTLTREIDEVDASARFPRLGGPPRHRYRLRRLLAPKQGNISEYCERGMPCLDFTARF